jgi:hypothetical protein
MGGAWWWRWDCIGPFHGWLAPDLRLYPERRLMFSETQIVRDGLGDLLQESTMLGDGIAVLHSYPSVFAHALGEGGSFGDCQTAHLAVISMVRELGLQFDCVTDRQMRLGEFDPQRWKVLFLPRTEALGDREAQVIREFAEQGGTVIADVRVGLYDDHCKPRPRGVLDDLFGVTRAASAPATSARASLEGESPMSFEEALVDPAVSLTDGVAGGAAEGIPVCMTRQVGQGQAILLNFAFGSFPRLNAEDTPQVAAATVQSWLAPAGVAPSVALFDKTGARAREIETVRWRKGDIEILALFPQSHRAIGPKWSGWNNTEPVRVQLPRPAYVFDLRQRQALGRQAAFTTTLIPFRANFFVLCEKPAPAPVVQWQRDAVTRGEVARATISVPGAQGLHALRLRARCGTQDPEWLSQNILVDGQAKTVELPVALNDPTGTYHVSAIDLFTNRPTIAELHVQ